MVYVTVLGLRSVFANSLVCVAKFIKILEFFIFLKFTKFRKSPLNTVPYPLLVAYAQLFHTYPVMHTNGNRVNLP